MHRICQTLAENGFSITLIGRKLPHSAPLERRLYNQIRLSCFFNKGKIFYAEYNIRLFWKLLFMKADVLCAIDLDTIMPVFWASFVRRKKRYFDAHEYFEEVPEVIDRKIVQAIWRWIAYIYIKRFHVCYTVSCSLAKELSRKYNKHFDVIRNVPYLTTESSERDRTYLLYHGALNAGRGLEVLIEAMQFIDMPLMIAGEGDISEKLRQLAQQLKLLHKINFLGYVKPDNLKPLLSGAFAGMNLLEHKSMSYYYSLANKFFDYIHAGVPVITMNFPEYRHINQQYEVGILLDTLSPAAIIDAVNRLKQDNMLYLRLKQNCNRAKMIYNWQRESANLLKLYV